MSRTTRSHDILKRRRGCFRKPRCARALRYSKDGFGIRKGAIPPTYYDDLDYSSFREDWFLKTHFVPVTRPTDLGEENDNS
jgi:hypothetical protein